MSGNSSSRATADSGKARRLPWPLRNSSQLCRATLGCSFRRHPIGDRLLVHLGDDAGHLGNAQHVEDQRHLPVAHDGRAGKAGDPFQLLAQRLHHDLFGVVDFVDHQPELAIVGLQHNDVVGRFRGLAVFSLVPSKLNSRFRNTSGSKRPRRRYTGTPWMCSMRRSLRVRPAAPVPAGSPGEWQSVRRRWRRSARE